MRPPFTDEQAAKHEAAHAVAHLAQGVAFVHVQLDRSGSETTGRVKAIAANDNLWIMPVDQIKPKVVSLLAGNEAIHLGEVPDIPPKSYLDEQKAKILVAREISARLGVEMSPDQEIANKNDSMELEVDYWAEILPEWAREDAKNDLKATMKGRRQLAREILSANVGAVNAIAAKLLEGSRNLTVVSYADCLRVWSLYGAQ